MERRLVALEHAAAARDLVADYALAIDGQDPDRLRTIFAPGMLLEAPGRRWEGIDAVVAFYEGVFAADLVPRRHFVTNVRVTDADADGAATTAYFLYTSAEGGDSILGWGRYRDRFAPVDGRLRFVAKHMQVDFSGPIQQGWA